MNLVKTGIPLLLKEKGNIPVVLADQTTQPIDALFSQSLGNFTLSADADVSTIDTLNYTLEATAGHSITTGSELILIDVAADKSLQAVAVNVATNTITIDRPLDHTYAAATTLGRRTTSNMAVIGSLVAPQIFSVRAGETPTDFTRFLITMLGITNPTMDDGKFGNLAALTNGLVFRIVNGFQKTIFNFKTNLDIKQFCFDFNYSAAAPAGNTGAAARISFAGQDKHGVALRISTGDVLQWVVQDDLTGLVALRIAGQGHDTQ